jgi:hypothetical protein
MRGIGEIHETNANPHHRSDEHFGARRTDGPDVNRSFESNLADVRRRAQAFHGERVEARQHQNDPRPSKGDIVVAAILADLAVGAIIDGIVNGPGRHGVQTQDRIQPGIDQPPFIEFWADLNERRERLGEPPEALYQEARTLFNGGETPVGAMTFVGKQWDGLRSVPAEPVKSLGGSRPAYHGEYREVTRHGVKWHKVVNDNDAPIQYKIPEAALCGAEHQRNERIEKQYR